MSVEAVRALARASKVLERSSGELCLAHYRVLSAIASGDERASRIAARLALGKPTISSTIDALCQRGLLVREGVEGDQRAAALSLSAAGEQTLRRAEAEMIETLDELCERTPDGARLIEALVWLGSAIDASAAERAGAR